MKKTLYLNFLLRLFLSFVLILGLLPQQAILAAPDSSGTKVTIKVKNTWLLPDGTTTDTFTKSFPEIGIDYKVLEPDGLEGTNILDFNEVQFNGTDWENSFFLSLPDDKERKVEFTAKDVDGYENVSVANPIILTIDPTNQSEYTLEFKHKMLLQEVKISNKWLAEDGNDLLDRFPAESEFMKIRTSSNLLGNTIPVFKDASGQERLSDGTNKFKLESPGDGSNPWVHSIWVGIRETYYLEASSASGFFFPTKNSQGEDDILLKDDVAFLPAAEETPPQANLIQRKFPKEITFRKEWLDENGKLIKDNNGLPQKITLTIKDNEGQAVPLYKSTFELLSEDGIFDLEGPWLDSFQMPKEFKVYIPLPREGQSYRFTETIQGDTGEFELVNKAGEKIEEQVISDQEIQDADYDVSIRNKKVKKPEPEPEPEEEKTKDFVPFIPKDRTKFTVPESEPSMPKVVAQVDAAQKAPQVRSLPATGEGQGAYVLGFSLLALGFILLLGKKYQG